MNKVNIGDTVYFANGCKNLTEGKVVHIFEYGREYYVIEYYCVVDHDLTIRDWDEISLTPDGPLHLQKRVRDLIRQYKEGSK